MRNAASSSHGDRVALGGRAVAILSLPLQIIYPRLIQLSDHPGKKRGDNAPTDVAKKTLSFKPEERSLKVALSGLEIASPPRLREKL